MGREDINRKTLTVVAGLLETLVVRAEMIALGVAVLISNHDELICMWSGRRGETNKKKLFCKEFFKSKIIFSLLRGKKKEYKWLF